MTHWVNIAKLKWNWSKIDYIDFLLKNDHTPQPINQPTRFKKENNKLLFMFVNSTEKTLWPTVAVSGSSVNLTNDSQIVHMHTKG